MGGVLPWAEPQPTHLAIDATRGPQPCGRGRRCRYVSTRLGHVRRPAGTIGAGPSRHSGHGSRAPFLLGSSDQSPARESPRVFGSSPRRRRPLLLVLVYGLFVALVGITATAQAVMVSAHFSAATLNDAVASEAPTTRAFMNAHVLATDFDAAGPVAGRVTILEDQLASLTRTGEVLRVELRRPDGTVVAANDPRVAGVRAGRDAAFAAAVAGDA